ncbi:YceD family protein [uncultured Parasphingorhabdus sp.]|uniref:YceD family protein n=1 Tax=uncultured Parasphingorhabdus sp. TaxID=2709694 RepID=UPI0030DA13D3|tara:strand:- start:15714 stop:16238 length:525 start_codon:yes stop_codon:yes gene_type:complete
MDAPEFSCIIKLSEIGSKPKTGKLVASAEERSALALRFDLPKISSLTASYKLLGGERGIGFSGKLESDLLQSCAITGEDIPVQVRDTFDILFIPKADPEQLEEEIELTEDECDIVEYEQAQVDLGEAIAQTLYLSLDPFPRGPNADEVARKKGLKSEAEAGPFGALAALKDKLG